jgi:hypothetical protein
MELLIVINAVIKITRLVPLSITFSLVPILLALLSILIFGAIKGNNAETYFLSPDSALQYSNIPFQKNNHDADIRRYVTNNKIFLNVAVPKSLNESTWLWANVMVGQEQGSLKILSSSDATIHNNHVSSDKFEWKKIGIVDHNAGYVTLELFSSVPRMFETTFKGFAYTKQSISRDEIKIQLEKHLSNTKFSVDGFSLILALFLFLILVESFEKQFIKKASNVRLPLLLSFLLYIFILLTQIEGVNVNKQASGVSEFSKVELISGRKGADVVFTKASSDYITSLSKQIRSLLKPQVEYSQSFASPQEHRSGEFESLVYSMVSNDSESNNDFSETILWGQLNNFQVMERGNFYLALLLPGLIFLVGIILTRFSFSTIGSIESRFLSTILRWLYRNAQLLALTGISIISIFISLHLSQGWDELYINLKHSRNLVDAGRYSLNVQNFVEGSVDFLPLLTAGILGFLGLELTNALVGLTLLGNVLVIIACYKIVYSVTNEKYWALLSAFVIALYPNVLWTGGTGFTANLFTGWALLATYFLFFTKREHIALVLLATLSLVRTEGVLLSLLLGGVYYGIMPLALTITNGRWVRYFTKGLTRFLFIVTPFIVSSVVRGVVYNHPLPIPIVYKNTGFDSSYVFAGMREFHKMLFSHEVPILVLLFVGLFVFYIMPRKSKKAFKSVKAIFFLPVIFFVFVMVYYSGGGDWFPYYWNRYALPFMVTFLICICAAMYVVSATIFSSSRNRNVLATLTLFLLGAFYALGMSSRLDNIWTYTYSKLTTEYKDTSPYWERINQLYAVGNFLKYNLDESSTIASPEVATIMYFAERDMVGLLGVSNKNIASMPLQPKNSGNLLHRRRGHYSIFEDRPDVIALYEPVKNFRGKSENVSLSEMQKLSLNYFFTKEKVDIAYYRVGSFQSLEDLGYKHVFVIDNKYIFSLFIHQNTFEGFNTNLKNHGYVTLGKTMTQYEYAQDLVSKFEPFYVPQMSRVNK